MATRQYDFNVGPETSTLPTVSDPSADSDIVIKSYADKTYEHGVADLAALKAIDATHRADLSRIYVRSLDAEFQFVSASSATANDISIVQPTAGTGRWFRQKDADRDSWYDTAATVAVVKAIDAIERVHGQVVFVQSLQKFFWFDSASVAVGDDVTVIAPTSGTGRWLQTAAAATANQYAAVVADPAISGFSTHTSLQSAHDAATAGKEVLVTPGTYVGNLNNTKQLKWTLQGYGTIISGNVTFASGSDYTSFEGGKVTGTITINSGVVEVSVTETAIDSISSVVNNSGNSRNFFDKLKLF